MVLDKIFNCIALLKSKKITVAFAEGASNGILSDAFAYFTSADSVFLGKIIAAKNHMKEYFFNIDKNIIQQYGSESPEVARVMAQNLRSYIAANICVSITGDVPDTMTQQSTNPIFVHIHFEDSDLSERVTVECPITPVVNQILSQICEHIATKFHSNAADSSEVA